MSEKGKAIYSTIDPGLEALISERAEGQSRSKASVISELLQKGLESEEVLKMAERAKDNLMDTDRLKSEISGLKQSSNGVSGELASVKKALSGLEEKNMKLSEAIRGLGLRFVELSEKVDVVSEELLKSYRDVSGELAKFSELQKAGEGAHGVYKAIGFFHCPECDVMLQPEKGGTLFSSVNDLKNRLGSIEERLTEAPEEEPEKETWAEQRLRERKEREEK